MGVETGDWRREIDEYDLESTGGDVHSDPYQVDVDGPYEYKDVPPHADGLQPDSNFVTTDSRGGGTEGDLGFLWSDLQVRPDESCFVTDSSGNVTRLVRGEAEVPKTVIGKIIDSILSRGGSALGDYDSSAGSGGDGGGE